MDLGPSPPNHLKLSLKILFHLVCTNTYHNITTFKVVGMTLNVNLNEVSLFHEIKVMHFQKLPFSEEVTFVTFRSSRSQMFFKIGVLKFHISKSLFRSL